MRLNMNFYENDGKTIHEVLNSYIKTIKNNNDLSFILHGIELMKEGEIGKTHMATFSLIINKPVKNAFSYRLCFNISDVLVNENHEDFVPSVPLLFIDYVTITEELSSFILSVSLCYLKNLFEVNKKTDYPYLKISECIESRIKKEPNLDDLMFMYVGGTIVLGVNNKRIDISLHTNDDKTFTLDFTKDICARCFLDIDELNEKSFDWLVDILMGMKHSSEPSVSFKELTDFFFRRLIKENDDPDIINQTPIPVKEEATENIKSKEELGSASEYGLAYILGREELVKSQNDETSSVSEVVVYKLMDERVNVEIKVTKKNIPEHLVEKLIKKAQKSINKVLYKK